MKLVSILMLLLFSLNTHSTELSPTQINLIQRNYECCYTQEVIDEVQQPIYNYQSTKFDLNLPPFRPVREPASRLSWTVFIGLQILDVYTTDNILKYGCVEELNPIFGKRPGLRKLLAVKFATVPISYALNKYYGPITDSDLLASNFLLTAVVANNFNVWNKAKSMCINNL